MFNFMRKEEKALKITSPVKGEVIDITKVPDEVFAKKLVGEGIAVIPSDGEIVAPCDGVITQIFKSNHAFTMETKEGIEILVHLGIDTVELKGEGFLRVIGDEVNVKRGDLLIKMDLEKIIKKGKLTTTMIIITNMDKVKSLNKNLDSLTDVSDVILELKLK